jgi:hypothetical protein
MPSPSPDAAPARRRPADSPAASDLSPAPTATLFGTNAASSPDAGYSLQQREQRADDYAGRVKTRISNIESGSEAERNVKFLNARPFKTPSGYFSGGLMAAGLDPDHAIAVHFDNYTGMGRPQSHTASDTRPYQSWQIAAGALRHDRPAQGGTVNFQSMHVDPADQARVNDLESIGAKLQSHWTQDVAGPMQDASGTLAARSGKADAYSARATLQSLQSDKAAFGRLSPQGQQAVNRTQRENGQVIIPNVYGYPLAGHAFIPYQPYDGNYEHRPNQGLMIGLNQGTVSEIRGDKDFANWARKNRDNLLGSFNAADRQGGLDAHWPAAGNVLDDLISGNHATYPGYGSLLSDQRIPAAELFNYTRARGSDYQLKYGNLTAGNNGIASQYQAVNAKDAAWADQTQVFGASAQNWKAAKEFWGNTFGYLPVAGNLGNIVFGAHDSVNGMTAKDRIGGNMAAAISSLQLMHDLAPGAAELTPGKSPALPNPARSDGSHWNYEPRTSEFSFRPPQPESSAAKADLAQGVRPNANNVKEVLPGLTPQGRQNAQHFFRDHGSGDAPMLRNQQDIDNATRFFNGGGKLKLSGGAGGNEPSPPPPRVNTGRRGLAPEVKNRITEYIGQNPHQTDAAVGRAFGVSPQAVGSIRRGIAPPGASGGNVPPTAERRTGVADYVRGHSGESDAAIGKRFNVPRQEVNAIRREIGKPKPVGAGTFVTPAVKARIAEYIHRYPDMTDNQIAQHFWVSPSTVNRVHRTLRAPAQRNAPSATATSATSAPVAGPSSAKDPSPSPSPLMEGLDLDTPLTPGHQQQADEIQATLPGGRNASESASAQARGSATDRGGPPASKRPRIDAPPARQPAAAGQASHDPNQPGTSGATSATAPQAAGSNPSGDSLADYVRQHPGESTRQIARRFNVPARQVVNIRDGLSLESLSGTPLTPELRTEITGHIRQHPEELDSGIARRFNVATPVIPILRRQIGVPRSTGGGFGLSPQRRGAIINYVRQHPLESNATIAQQFSIDPTTVYKIRHQTGLVKTSGRGIPVPPARRNEIADYVRQHPSESDVTVGNRFQVGHSTVNRIRALLDNFSRHATPAATPRPAASPGAPDLHAPAPPPPVGRIRAELEAALPPSDSNQSFADWMLDHLSDAELQRAGNQLDRFRAELENATQPPDHNEPVIQWMLNHLSDEEQQRVNALSEDAFNIEVELIRQYLAQQPPS